MSKQGVSRVVRGGRLACLLLTALTSLALQACGGSVQRTYTFAPSARSAAPPVMRPSAPSVASAPQVATPRVVMRAPAPVAAAAPAANTLAPYSPIASPLLAAFDSRPRGVAPPRRPETLAATTVSTRTTWADSYRPYYGYRSSYGYRPYYGYGPSYAYTPYHRVYPGWGLSLGWSGHRHGHRHHGHYRSGSYRGSFSGGHGHAGWRHGTQRGGRRR